MRGGRTEACLPREAGHGAATGAANRGAGHVGGERYARLQCIADRHIGRIRQSAMGNRDGIGGVAAGRVGQAAVGLRHRQRYLRCERIAVGARGARAGGKIGRGCGIDQRIGSHSRRECDGDGEDQ